jgi:hypothetical protein
VDFDGFVGYSGHTPEKQQDFQRLATIIFGAISGIVTRYRYVSPRAVAIDLNAGPGDYPNCLGSPLITLEAARKFQLPLDLHLCEADQGVAARLRETLESFGLLSPTQEDGLMLRSQDPRDAITAWIWPESYQTAWPKIVRTILRRQEGRVYGLIYSDENGSEPPFALLREAAERLERVDLISHVSATNLKRLIGARYRGNEVRLSEQMLRLGKRFWLIREPRRQHQWTFLLGTNWDNFPEYTKAGFFDSTSARGRNIICWLSYSERERLNNEQYPLFGP